MRFLKYWLPLMAWAVVILAASTDIFSAGATSGWLERALGARGTPVLNITIRKIAHLVEYALLALLAWRAIRSEIEDPDRRHPLATLFPMGVTLAVAITDESLQSLTHTRSGSPWDVLLDLTGAALALLAVNSVSRRRRIVR